MVFMPNKSTPDYLFEKANQCFRRSRTDSNARDALEALGNAFMVKAVELDIKLQKLGNDNSSASSPARARRYGQLHFDRTEFSCREEQGTASEFLEVGDLSCREIKPNKAIISIFSHHGDRQSGRKRSAQTAIGQAPCKPSRLSGLSRRNVRVESASPQ